MSIKTMVSTQIPAPKPGKISVVVAPYAVRESLMFMLATLALHSSRVMVVDGGNVFDGYALARELRRQTVHIYGVIDRVKLSRVFTCYQMPVRLSRLPEDGTPVVVLDLLGTFFDENISIKKRHYLLYQSLDNLRKLGAIAPVAIWLRTRSTKTAQDQQLFYPVLQIASDIWEVPEAEPTDYQLSLF